MVACFSVMASAFALVYVPPKKEIKENLSLAEITLQHLTPYLLLSLHLLKPSAHILLYLDAIWKDFHHGNRISKSRKD